MKGISMEALLVAIVIYGGMSVNAQPQPINITPIDRLLTDVPAGGGGGLGGVFDVTKCGAVSDGATDMSQALIKAWTDACSSTSPSKVVIPPGDYLAGVTKLVGPCKAPIALEINGIIKASTTINGDCWLSIEGVTNLKVYGTGTLDGQVIGCKQGIKY